MKLQITDLAAGKKKRGKESALKITTKGRMEEI